jgi:excisionase family DNA binding protein
VIPGGERIWLDVKQAAERAGNHAQTIRKALEAGELHGTQRVTGGRWRIHRDCLDAWCAREKCAHQRRATLEVVAS